MGKNKTPIEVSYERDDTPCTTVNGIVPKNYIGKEVNELLNNIKWQYIRYTYITEPPYRLQACCFVYSDSTGDEIKVYVCISNRDLKYLETVRVNDDWDVNLFKKEIIRDVECERMKKVLKKGRRKRK
jgi:hypothetical protein